MTSELKNVPTAGLPGAEDFRKAVADAMATSQARLKIHDRVALATAAHLVGQLAGTIMVHHGDCTETDLMEEVGANIATGFASAVAVVTKAKH